VVFLRFKSVIPVILVTVLSSFVVFGQETADKKVEKKAEPNTAAPLFSTKDGLKKPTAEQLIETTIFVYGLGGGRASLNQVRRTAFERGKVSVANAEGKMEHANYQRWITRDETSNKRKIRLDQEFPTARYSLVFNDDKIFVSLPKPHLV
jgi:photosystem II stability/assembly factor-like uncharacterized protein